VKQLPFNFKMRITKKYYHVNQAENERDLHLVSVEERDLVLGDLPYRIKAHVIGVHLVLGLVAGIQHRLLRGQCERKREVFPEDQK
jgi:hypothetical protein